ncbi:MAG: GNAT family N-acetyltransferase [Oscillospiraceae bacterium]
MKKSVLYVHGKGGSAEEADRYKDIFDGYDVFGADYKTFTPWETKSEIIAEYELLQKRYDSVTIIANSIGAYFTMNALSGKKLERAFFISPIVNMEKLITDMMMWAGVTEGELCEKGEIETSFGETLSWEYLCYVRDNPVVWNTPTDIIYGEKDNLTSYDTVSEFSEKNGFTLTVMENGEHWFHTEEQLAFLDEWLKRLLDKEQTGRIKMNYTIKEERLTADEYIGFLKETDLGSQYPKERFNERINTLVNKASISLAARDERGRIVGVCFGITDFAYWLFMTDLGVIRECTGQGIGKALVRKLHEAAGGEKDIIMYTCVNENAIPFYEKLGMTRPDDVMTYNCIEWTDFTVE